MKNTELKKEKLRLAGKLYSTRTELGIKQLDLQKEGIISQSHLFLYQTAKKLDINLVITQ